MDKEYLQSLLELYNPKMIDFNSSLYGGGFDSFKRNTDNQIDLNIPQTILEQAEAQNYNFLPEFLRPQGSDPRSFQSIFPTDVPKGITASSVAKDMTSIPYGAPGSEDNYQGFTDKVDFSKPSEASGIEKLISYLPFGEKSVTGSLVRAFLPEPDPAAQFMKNFYDNRFGLTPTGQVASGIMAGYNPVSGGFLNKITGGRIGDPMKVGLQNAYQKRIDTIKKTLQKKYIDKGRSLDETELDERLAELEKLKADELAAFEYFIKSKAPQSKGLGDIGTGGAGGAGTEPTIITKKTTTGGGGVEDKPSPMQIKASKSPKVGVSGYTKRDDIRDSFRGRYG